MPALGELNADHAAVGLAAGTLLAFLLIGVRSIRPWAPALTAAVMVGLVVGELSAGLALTGAVIVVAAPHPASPWLLRGATGLAAGALVVLAFDPSVEPAVAIAIFLAVPLAVLTSSELGRDAPVRLTATLAVLAFGGVYGGVPDTESILRLLGVLVPVALLTAWSSGPSTGRELALRGIAAPVVALLWVAGSSSRGELAPVIGAVGCLGLLLVGPLARAQVKHLGHRGTRIPRDSPMPRDTRTTALLVTIQVFVVAACSRIAAISGDTAVATVTVVVALATGLALSAAVLRRAALPERPPR